MASIARKNLLEDLPRFLVAQVGIMVAVSLVTIQTGILNGFNRSTTQFIEDSPADLWLTSKNMENLDLTVPIPYYYLQQAQQLAGVERAEPLIIQWSFWRDSKGRIEPIRLIGFDLQGELFQPQNLTKGNIDALSEPYTVIVDETDLDILNTLTIGDAVEVGSLPAKLVGFTRGNNSIVADTFVFTSLENANAYLHSGFQASVNCTLTSGLDEIKCTNLYFDTSLEEDASYAMPQELDSADLVSYILIRAKPGEDLQVLKQQLEETLPNIRAYTCAELAAKNRTFWQQRTNLGFVLGLGAAVGVIVGMVIVGQVLYSSVCSHLKEFGTLKAMGASDWVIYRVIVEQGLWMAVLGYVPSMAFCLGLGSWTLATQGVVILITPTAAVAIFGLTVGMCLISGFCAIQRVIRVDPAIAFKG